MALTNRELELAATLLEIAADKMGRAICNDFNLIKQGKMTSRKERRDFMIAMEESNGDEETLKETIESESDHEWACDFAVARYLADRLRSEIKDG